MPAFTDKYFDPSQAGSGHAGTLGDPWSVADLTGLAAGQRIFVKGGTHARTATLAPGATAGTATAPILWVGCDASFNPCMDWTNGPVLDFSGSGAGDGWSIGGNYHAFWNIYVRSAFNNGFGTTRAFTTLIGCRSNYNGIKGFNVSGAGVLAIRCEASYNLNDGIYLGGGDGVSFLCKAVENRGHNIRHTGNSLNVSILNYARKSGTGSSAAANNLSIENGASLALASMNTLDAPASSTVDSNLGISAIAHVSSVANLFTNAAGSDRGLGTVQAMLCDLWSNYWGNGTDRALTFGIGLDVGMTAENPAYVDIGNNDYNAGGLSEIAPLTRVAGIRAGADQIAAAGATPSAYRPRMRWHNV